MRYYPVSATAGNELKYNRQQTLRTLLEATYGYYRVPGDYGAEPSMQGKTISYDGSYEVKDACYAPTDVPARNRFLITFGYDEQIGVSYAYPEKRFFVIFQQRENENAAWYCHNKWEFHKFCAAMQALSGGKHELAENIISEESKLENRKTVLDSKGNPIRIHVAPPIVLAACRVFKANGYDQVDARNPHKWRFYRTVFGGHIQSHGIATDRDGAWRLTVERASIMTANEPTPYREVYSLPLINFLNFKSRGVGMKLMNVARWVMDPLDHGVLEKPADAPIILPQMIKKFGPPLPDKPPEPIKESKWKRAQRLIIG